MKQYLKNNVFTLILVAFLTFVLIAIPSQIKVSLASLSTVSPRFFPYVSTIGALVCCVLSLIVDAVSMLVRKKKNKPEAIAEKDTNISYIRVVFCIVLLLVWYLVLKRVGFIISTMVVMFILSYMLGNRNKISLILFPLIFTIVIYFVFSQLLHVNLPEILF